MALLSSSPEKAFNPSLHGLRGFAALAVFFFHVYDMSFKVGAIPGDISASLRLLITSLASGVDLFFMISGFLITGSLIRHANVFAFLKDRAIRIYPVFLFLHLLLFPVAPFLGYKWMQGLTLGAWAGHFFSNLFFLPGVFDLPLLQLNAWSLSYELAFYLVAAAAFALFKRNAVACALLLVSLVPALIFLHPRFVFFLIGSCIFFLLRSGKRFPNWGLWALLPFLGLAGWMIDSEVYERAFFAVPFGFLLFWDVVSGANPFAVVLRSRFMQFFGTISYSFYLWHAVVMYPLKFALAKILIGAWGLAPLPSILAFGVVSFGLSTFVSWISYLLLEKKLGHALRKRFSRTKEITA